MARCRIWLYALSTIVVGVHGAAAAGIVETGAAAYSAALGRTIPYTLYRPSPAPRSGHRWPVLYLLHGRGGSDSDWTRFGNIAATFDAAIAAGRVQPMLVIMPAVGNSWYVDDMRPAGFGPVARAMTGDLIAAVDAAYPTAACREGRAIAGISMGGFGALLYAFDHPELFAAAISLSGSVLRRPPRDDRGGGWGLDARFGGVFGSPFDWRRYQRWSIFPRVSKLATHRQRPDIWLAAGDQDLPAILEGNVMLHLALRKYGLRSELRIDDARHAWSYWRRAIAPALEWLSPKLAAACGATQSATAGYPVAE